MLLEWSFQVEPETSKETYILCQFINSLNVFKSIQSTLQIPCLSKPGIPSIISRINHIHHKKHPAKLYHLFISRLLSGDLKTHSLGIFVYNPATLLRTRYSPPINSRIPFALHILLHSPGATNTIEFIWLAPPRNSRLQHVWHVSRFPVAPNAIRSFWRSRQTDIYSGVVVKSHVIIGILHRIDTERVLFTQSRIWCRGIFLYISSWQGQVRAGE